MHFELPPKEVYSTKEQLDAMHIPNNLRDQCVDFAVMLRRCRAQFSGRPIQKCDHEKHIYEHCEYELTQQLNAKYHADQIAKLAAVKEAPKSHHH